MRVTHCSGQIAYRSSGGGKRGSMTTMAQPSGSEKLPLTIYLSPDLALRLKAAAEAQRRAAADLVSDLLDRHLPRAQAGGSTKGKVPYT